MVSIFGRYEENSVLLFGIWEASLDSAFPKTYQNFPDNLNKIFQFF